MKKLISLALGLVLSLTMILGSSAAILAYTSEPDEAPVSEPETVDIPIRVTWSYIADAPIVLQLYANGKELESKDVSYDGEKEAKVIFASLPKFDKSDKPIEYKVQWTWPEGCAGNVAYNSNTGEYWLTTAENTDTFSVSGTPLWEGEAPVGAQITYTLYEKGKLIDKRTITVTGKESYHDAYYFDKHLGNDYTLADYSLEVTSPEGWTLVENLEPIILPWPQKGIATAAGSGWQIIESYQRRTLSLSRMFRFKKTPEPDTSQEEPPQEHNDKVPDTGDEGIVLWLLLMAASTGGVVAVKKRFH